MNATPVARGASRLPLTTKRGNKDFYKGTGQSYVPGGGHRTGPPGKHVIGGKAKFRIMDDKVRYYVGPGADILNKTDLKAYVSNKESRLDAPARPHYNRSNPPISFSPNVHHIPLLVPRHSAPYPSTSSSSASSEDATSSLTSTLKRIRPHDTKAYSKWYQALPHEERNRLVQETRKEWYIQMVKKSRGIAVVDETAAEQEAETVKVETRASEDASS